MGLLILVYAIDDMQNKSIHPGLIILGIAETILCLCGNGDVSIVRIIAGSAPGAVLLIIACMTDQSIGRADAEMLIMLGIVYGAGQAITTLLIACFVFIVMNREKDGGAFIPALFVAFIIERVLKI